MTTGWSKSKASEFLRPEEVTALLAAIASEGDKLLLRTMWETGGRPGEVCRLVPENIVSENNCILLQNFKQNKRKDPSEQRKPHPLKRVYLFPESTLCKDLTEYCKSTHIKSGEWVFPSRRSASKPFNSVTLWRMVTTLTESLGIRYIKKDKRTGEYMNKPAWPHLVRHSYAMSALSRIGRLDIIQKQLGHASISATEVYAGVSDEDRRKAIQGS